MSVPPAMGYWVGAIIGKMVGDVVITREEIEGLMADLLYVDVPPASETRLTDWARENVNWLGKYYASELSRRKDRMRTYITDSSV